MPIFQIFSCISGLVFALAVAAPLCWGEKSPECDHRSGCDQLAEICKACQRLTLTQKASPYLMAKEAFRQQYRKTSDKTCILPNIAGPILVTAVLDIGTMMMELAGLSFLGLGVKPPMAEWGSMINDGRSMLQISPWMVLAPRAAILLQLCYFNLLGDTIRDLYGSKRTEQRKMIYQSKRKREKI